MSQVKSSAANAAAQDKSLEQLLEEFNNFLDQIVGRVEKARANFRKRLDENIYYSHLFAGEVKELARAETVERECRRIKLYLNDLTVDDSVMERLKNISQQIDRQRLQFHVTVERSTCPVANEVANCQMEAMHAFLFSRYGTAVSDDIQSFCRRAAQSG